MEFLFEWDEDKALANLAKHGISFEEAQTVFGDPDSLTLFDKQHSHDEDRFIDIGRSDSGLILVVVYAERNARIRIISCRRATPGERKQYGQQHI